MKIIRAVILIGVLISTTYSLAQAETLGEVETSGLLFKDSLTIEAFDDPTLQGVTCYTTVHNKALSFEDSSSTSLSCRKTGKISGPLTDKSSVFSRNKNLFFKKTVVDRFWDSKRRVLVYIAYTTKMTGSNASNSISVVVVD